MFRKPLRYFPCTMRLMSLSLLSASTGVRLLISKPNISSLIWQRIGSSSWKKEKLHALFRLLYAAGIGSSHGSYPLVVGLQLR